jgi:hypothetical protein
LLVRYIDSSPIAEVASEAVAKEVGNAYPSRARSSYTNAGNKTTNFIRQKNYTFGIGICQLVL